MQAVYCVLFDVCCVLRVVRLLFVICCFLFGVCVLSLDARCALVIVDSLVRGCG